MNQNRRSFLKYLLSGASLALAGFILYPILAYLKPPKSKSLEINSVKVAKLGEIPVDSSIIFRFGNKPGILIRKSKDDFRAFDATCTHLDCTVQYKKELGVIWCACHNGKYDLNGKNISGPPPKPLNPYKVVIQGEDIIITKI